VLGPFTSSSSSLLASATLWCICSMKLQKKGGESLEADCLQEFALNCHTRYNESHPVTLIYWYLNSEKISIYFDVFLGPTESKAVSPSHCGSASFLKVHICRIRECFWPSNLSIYLSIYLSIHCPLYRYAFMKFIQSVAAFTVYLYTVSPLKCCSMDLFYQIQ